MGIEPLEVLPCLKAEPLISELLAAEWLISER